MQKKKKEKKGSTWNPRSTVSEEDVHSYVWNISMQPETCDSFGRGLRPTPHPPRPHPLSSSSFFLHCTAVGRTHTSSLTVFIDVCVHGQFSHLGALWLNVVWQVEAFYTINYG